MSDSESNGASQKLRDRQNDLVKILEALDVVVKSKGWQTLKELVFDDLVERVERRLLSEAKSPEVDVRKLHHLQGELAWARRYADLKSYAEGLKKELQGIKDNK